MPTRSATSSPSGARAFAHRVLIVDSDEATRAQVKDLLATHAIEVLEAADALHGFQMLERERPELVLLDLVLPGISGTEILTYIRQRSMLPVILLTTVDAEESKVRGLQLGADDYVVKPFSQRELAARVGALLRRSQAAGPGDRAELAFEGLRIDLAGRTVWRDGREVPVTTKEFELLAYLAARPGIALTRHQLLRDVWHSSHEWQQDATVTEHVRRLRVKIEDDPNHPRWLQTVRGIGYRFSQRTRVSGDQSVGSTG